jgi:chromosome segregation ATPase
MSTSIATATSALREVQTFAKMFRNVLALEEQLKEAGTLESMIAAHKNKLESASRETANAEAALAASRLKYETESKAFEDKIAGEFESKRAAAMSSYDLEMAKANDALLAAVAEHSDLAAETARVKSAAKEEAKQIVHDAKARAQALDDAMTAKIVAKDSELAAADQKLLSIQSEVAAHQTQLEAARAEIARLKNLFK